MQARSGLGFSLSFFSANASNTNESSKYKMLTESAKLADELGFAAIWLPERHFQTFGGLYPSPSVIGAALSVLTKRIKICAGSVVMPLNDPLRVAEEWSIVDNLSNGRVAIAFASGWHVNDFVLAAPNCFNNRHDDMYSKISRFQELWGGGKVNRLNGVGQTVEIGILPSPIQPEIPISLTAGSDETFFKAGELGFNILTSNFANRTPEILCRRIAKYRETIRNVHGRAGRVAMMVHSYIGSSDEEARAKAQPPLLNYLEASMKLQEEHGLSLGLNRGPELSEMERLDLVESATEHYVSGPLSFIGGPTRCRRQAELFYQYGVDELACLIDFGIDINDCLTSVRQIGKLNSQLAAEHLS